MRQATVNVKFNANVTAMQQRTAEQNGQSTRKRHESRTNQMKAAETEAQAELKGNGIMTDALR